MNPLDWSGPQFLMAYSVFLVGAFVAARVCQHMMREPIGTPERFELDLDPYEMAALQGVDYVTHTAVTTLVQNGRLRIEDGDLRVAAELPSNAHRVERAVYQFVKQDGDATNTELRSAAQPEMHALERSLQQRGFLLAPEQAQRLRWTSLLIFTAALGLGVLKMLIGLSRDRPVAFLVMLMLFASILGYSVLLMSSTRRLSRRGDEALKLLRQQNQPLLMTATTEGAALNGTHLALAVALFGTSALAGSSYGELHGMLGDRPTSGGGSDFDSSSSCSSSSDSGGGDGGGGGGCGGCGGGGGD